MQEYWYDAEADIMYYQCLTFNEYVTTILLSIICFQTIIWIIKKLKQ